MPDRVDNQRLAAKNPVERNYAEDRDNSLARDGYETLDRANPGGFFNRNRPGLTSPAGREPNSDRGDEIFPPTIIY